MCKWEYHRPIEGGWPKYLTEYNNGASMFDERARRWRSEIPLKPVELLSMFETFAG